MARVRVPVPGFAPVPVRAHDGSVWDVGVEWLPRTPRLLARWRKADVTADPGDVVRAAVDVGGDGDGIVAVILLAVATAVFVVVLVVFVLPAVLLLVDVLVLVVAAVVAVGLKVLLRRPWRVVARCASGPSAGEQQVREVVGVRAARGVRDELRAAIAVRASPAA